MLACVPEALGAAGDCRAVPPLLRPLSCGLADAGPGGGREVSQVSQQKQNAQLTSTWWRRMAMSARTWKSAHPSSSLTCLNDCSTLWRLEYANSAVTCYFS